MDRSLWLLLVLRGKAWARRFARSLSSLKGILLGVVGFLLFLPMTISIFIAPRIQTAGQIASIREFGPLGLFLYCLLNVILSSGERAVTYSPAEVNFLFPGPYRPRQILLYRMVGGTFAATLTAFAMTFAFAHHAASFVSAFVGLFLALELLYLFSMSMGLLVGTLGAIAFSVWRRGVLLGFVLLVAGILYSHGESVLALPLHEIVAKFIENRVVAVLLIPFTPAVMAFAAERAYPDLVHWTALGLLVDLGFLVLNLLLNARFLEASAKTSAKVYARLKQARAGSLVASAGKARFAVPMFPFVGGIGPIFWRQFVTLSRTLSRLLAFLLIFMIPVGTFLFASTDPVVQGNMLPVLITIAAIAFVAPSMIGYDFRSDIDRIEQLKAMPLSPTAIAAGQLLTPMMVLCVGEWSALGLVVVVSRSIPEGLASFALALIPLNLILVAIENLYFLWYPFRSTTINAVDVQAMGRQVLLLFAKMISVSLIAGIGVGLGWLAYHLSGDQWNVGLFVTWTVMTTLGIGLLPFISAAFRQFDVTQGTID